MSKTTYFKKFSPVILISLIELVVFAIQAPFEMEPLHDGLAFAMATATTQDLLPNKDFFAQYGPIAPLIFGSVLKLFGNIVLILRLMTAITLTIIGTFLFLVLKRFISLKSAFLLSLTWAVTAPIYLELNTNLPWATVLTSLFSIMIIYTLILMKSNVLYGKKFHAQFSLVAILLILCLLTRPQLVTNFLLIILVATYCAKNAELFRFRNVLALNILGFSLIAGFILFTLGIAKPWIEQSFIWSIKYYAIQNSSTFDKARIVDLLLYFLFPLYFLFFWVIQIYVNKFRRYMVIEVVGFFAIIIMSYIQNVKIENKSFLNINYLFVYFCQNFFSILGYSAAVAILFYSYKSIFNKKLSIFDKVINIIGLSTIFQFYPVHDQLHLWWLTPVMLASIASRFNTLEVFRIRIVEHKFQVLSYFIILGSMINIFTYVTAPRLSYESNLLKGMSGERTAVVLMDKTLKALNELPTDARIGFDCPAAFYSVFDGRFIPQKRNMVNWEPNKGNLIFDFDHYDYIFVCWIKDNDPKITYYSKGSQVIFRAELPNGLSNRIYTKPIS